MKTSWNQTEVDPICPFCEEILAKRNVVPSAGYSLCRACHKRNFHEQAFNSKTNFFSLFEKIETRKEKATEPIRKELKDLPYLLDQKMRRLEFELEVFFQNEKAKIEEASEMNRVLEKEILPILTQVDEHEITPEFLAACDVADQLLDYHFKKDTCDLQQVQKGFLTNLKKTWRSTLGVLGGVETSKIMEKVSSRLGRSEPEGMLKILKTMKIFRFEANDEGWLIVSPFKKGKGEMSFQEISGLKKIDLRMEGAEWMDVMVFGLNFLLKNCLKKVSTLRFSFCGGYFSNQEARRFAGYVICQDVKFLTMDFNKVVFESEETPLIFFQDETVRLELLEGFKFSLKNTNATEKTVKDFGKLIVPRMKNLNSLGLDFQNLSITDPIITLGLLKKCRWLNTLELSVKKTDFADDGVILFAEKVLPALRDLQELRLWFDNTKITDEGLLRLFKSIHENLGSKLKAFVLGIGQNNNVTDESILKFAHEVLPEMESLEEFRLLVERTPITDESMVALCQNIKYLVSGIKILGLDVAETACTDKMINALIFCIPFMEKIDVIDIWSNGTSITNKSIARVYSCFPSRGGTLGKD